MIKAEQLSFRYRDPEGGQERLALQAIDLDIREGEFVAILGHNGSGKSTLAKHINAILLPYEGNLWVDGRNTRQEELIWEIRQRAGMVFQNPDNQIIGTMVEEDVAFGPENLGVETKKIWERVLDSLKRVGMLDYRKHSPNRLSGGQKQRVAIAGVLAMKPKCIVLDEPTAMLDPIGRKEVLETVCSLRNEGVTVVLITHHMEEVVEADRVIVMDRGEIVMQGSPRDIFSRVEELKQLRLGVPAATQLAYQLAAAGMPLEQPVLTREELLGSLKRVWQSGVLTAPKENNE